MGGGGKRRRREGRRGDGWGKWKGEMNERK